MKPLHYFYLLFPLLLVNVLLLSPSLRAQSLTAKTQAYIDSITEATFPANEPGGVLLVAQKGVPVYRKAFGLAHVELQVANQPHYKFRIGSITKQFTAVAILQLAGQGKLSLQDDLHKYLPTFNTHGKTITLEQLLTHTSGIQSYTGKKDFSSKARQDFTQEELLRYFMEDSLNFEPGTDWRYNNSGYFLLGMIVEKVSGLSYEQYLRKYLWEPLGMSNTLLGTYEKVIPHMVSGYQSGKDNTLMPASYLSYSQPWAAGAMVSTVDDLLKWDEALYSDRLLPQSWLQKAWTSYTLKDGKKTQYGYGWGLGRYRDLTIVEHGGGINGFVCLGVRIPEEHVYAILLTNAGGAKSADIALPIALQVAGRPVSFPKPITLSASKLQQYTGIFELPHVPIAGLTEEFSVRNDTLISKVGPYRQLKFVPVAKDRFFAKENSSLVKFLRDNKGSITGLETSSLYGNDMVRQQRKISRPVASK